MVKALKLLLPRVQKARGFFIQIVFEDADRAAARAKLRVTAPELALGGCETYGAAR